jgi:GAF domain-containing protein
MATGDRLVRILAELSSGGATEPEAARLCDVCVDVCLMSGAGIMLMAGKVQSSVCSSDEVSALIEELQYTLEEGPCVDAYLQDRPVLEPNLAEPRTPRWFAFAPPAVEAGVRAIFGFPLQVGAVRLGALNLYRARPGPLSDEQNADALVLAGVAARAVLAMQAHAPPGELAPELERGANFHFVVHQATGMVGAELGVSAGDALRRLRAYAFTNGRMLTEVANDVVARKLRFDDPRLGPEPL